MRWAGGVGVAVVVGVSVGVAVGVGVDEVQPEHDLINLRIVIVERGSQCVRTAGCRRNEPVLTRQPDHARCGCLEMGRGCACLDWLATPERGTGRRLACCAGVERPIDAPRGEDVGRLRCGRWADVAAAISSERDGSF